MLTEMDSNRPIIWGSVPSHGDVVNLRGLCRNIRGTVERDGVWKLYDPVNEGSKISMYNRTRTLRNSIHLIKKGFIPEI